MLEDAEERISRIEVSRASETEYGMARISSSSNVTEENGIVLPAREKNAALEGTIAYEIKRLESALPVKQVIFSGVSKGITYEISVYGKIAVYSIYADESLEEVVPSGSWYTFAPGKVIPSKYWPKDERVHSNSFVTLIGRKMATIGINPTNGWFGLGWVYDAIQKNDKFYTQLIWSFD